jgi:hypothetical protein
VPEFGPIQAELDALISRAGDFDRLRVLSGNEPPSWIKLYPQEEDEHLVAPLRLSVCFCWNIRESETDDDGYNAFDRLIRVFVTIPPGSLRIEGCDEFDTDDWPLGEFQEPAAAVERLAAVLHEQPFHPNGTCKAQLEARRASKAH